MCKQPVIDKLIRSLQHLGYRELESLANELRNEFLDHSAHVISHRMGMLLYRGDVTQVTLDAMRAFVDERHEPPGPLKTR